MLRPGTHVTAGGRELELVCVAKCGHMRGWFARPCRDGVPERDRETWVCDSEIKAVIDKRTRQYLMEMAYADAE